MVVFKPKVLHTVNRDALKDTRLKQSLTISPNSVRR